MPESNITVARDIYDTIAKGDMDHLRDQLSDDVTFHVPGRGPLAGDYQGKDDVLRYLAQVTERTGATISFEPQDFLAGQDHAAVLVRVRGERNGRMLDDRGVHVFRIADGKIAERWSYPQDLYKTDEFFA
jgi:uncharacterized protein